MRLKLTRDRADGKSTVGILSKEDGHLCFTLEDPWHPVKIPGETCIPAGTYNLRVKPIGSSKFDHGVHAYAKRFPTFYRGMIELEDVPEFQGVLIHCGNSAVDTRGCVLVGTDRVHRGVGWFITESALAFKRVYPPIAAAILANEPTTLEIVDAYDKENEHADT